MPHLPRTFTLYLRLACAVAALAAAYACDSRTPTDPAPALIPFPLRGNESGDAELGSISLTPSGSYSQFATIPENAWALVRVSGKWIVESNPACAGQPPNWPCSSLTPYSGYDLEYPDAFRGPVRLATVSPTGSFDFLELRGSGGPDDGIGLTQREFSRDVLASPALINPSVQQFGTTGPSVASYIIDGSYTVTVTRIASPIRVTEGAVEADGSRTYTVEPLYGLQFINPLGSFEPPGAVRWFFVPGDNVDPTAPNSDPPWRIDECRNQTTCRWTPPGPGRVQVSASVETRRARARNQDGASPCLMLVADDCGDSGARLSVSCTPAGLIRGDTIRCSSTVTPAQPFTIIRRIGQGRGFAVIDSTQRTYAAGDSDLWVGPAIAKTRVTIVARLAGASDSLIRRTEFEPRQRQWAVYQITNPQVDTAVDPRKMTVPPTGVGALGTMYLSGLSTRATPVLRAGTGPNAGLAVLAVRPEHVNPRIGHIFLHPALFTPSTDSLNQKWFNDQNGNPNGTCGQNKMPALRAEAERHEGATLSTDSHVGIANREFRSGKPHEEMEEFYMQTTSDSTLRHRAWLRYNNWYTNKYFPAQLAYDSVQYPKIYGTILGCVLDSNPTNP